MTRSVLITDGEQRAALAAVRSLGQAGYRVHVCAGRSRSIASTSRFCGKSFIVPDPLRESKGFLSEVTRVASAIKADVLLPVSEAALLAVLPYRDRLKCAIPFPSASAFEQICDKRQVLEAGKAHGIAVPSQAEIASLGDVAQLHGSLRFPVVVKPSRSISGREGERISAGVMYAMDANDLSHVLERIPRVAYPVLLQQRINGPGFGISVLVWDGELVAAFAHRRIREKPPSGGVSVLRESIPIDYALLNRSLALLRDFSWQGVAMVEFKLDDETGVPYLMEINGRLWGSLQLAIDAGVDFPNLLVELALGSKPAPVTTYSSGVRSRWEWGDVDHLLASLLHPSRVSGFTANGLPHRRFRALSQFLRSFRPSDRPEVFRVSDPGPFIQETKDWFRGR